MPWAKPRAPSATRSSPSLAPAISAITCRRDDAMKFLELIGSVVVKFLGHLGRLTIFAGTSLSHCLRPPFYPRRIASQMMDIGYFSLPVVGLTAIFSGMVLALQSYTGFARFSAGSETAVANV